MGKEGREELELLLAKQTTKLLAVLSVKQTTCTIDIKASAVSYTEI